MSTGGLTALEAAQRQGPAGVTYVVGDVTDPPEGLGTFEFFLDIGCLGGLALGARRAAGQAVTRLASPAATLPLLTFGPNPTPFLVAVSRAEVEETFPDWDLISVDAAQTAGLGWPMNRSSPTWYRLRRRPYCERTVWPGLRIQRSRPPCDGGSGGGIVDVGRCGLAAEQTSGEAA